MDAMPCTDRRPALWSRCASCQRRFALAPEASLCQSCADEADALRRLEEEPDFAEA
jgi:rRNA maturation endonuclease Nob1